MGVHSTSHKGWGVEVHGGGTATQMFACHQTMFQGKMLSGLQSACIICVFKKPGDYFNLRPALQGLLMKSRSPRPK